MKQINMVITAVNHCLLYTALFKVAYLERNLPNSQVYFNAGHIMPVFVVVRLYGMRENQQILRTNVALLKKARIMMIEFQTSELRTFKRYSP